MRKCVLWMSVLAMLLTGCAAETVMETVADEQAVPVMAQMREICLQLPEEAASPAVESDSGRLYICENYEISVQILDGGDLDRTMLELSGYDRDALTVMTTRQDNLNCYEFVWACAGEQGDQVGRAMVLDDGNYHYCVSVLGEAEAAAENRVFWEDMFGSFTLS